MVFRVFAMIARKQRGARPRREEGIALVAVIVMLAVIGATAVDFSYNARVDFVAAINGRDELRAHYLTRSALNLSELLLQVQRRLIDPNRKMLGGMDLQISDYAPMMMMAFNKREGAEMLGSLLGVGEGEVRGLGVDIGDFDLEMESLDGRINLNCAGGPNAGAPSVMRVAAALAALMLPQRYDPLFEQPDADGQFNDRATVLRAIVDWADQDLQSYGGTGPEDYRYNLGKHPYETKSQYYDTLEELRLVRGVDDDFMAAFGDQLTVYGSCKINVGLAQAPTIMSLIMQYADSPNDPGLHFRNLALLARYVVEIGALQGGFATPKDFSDAVENPMGQLGIAAAVDNLLDQGRSEQPTGLPPVVGVKLTGKVNEAIVGSGPRRIWQLSATAQVGMVRKRIMAVWDQTLISMQAGQSQAGPGGYVYWREE